MERAGCRIPLSGRRIKVTRPLPDVAVVGLSAAVPHVVRASRWLAALCLAISSVGCVLTQDIPDPALDIPGTYKSAGAIDPNAQPKLDWWRGFGSSELTSLMEEAQRVNLD